MTKYQWGYSSVWALLAGVCKCWGSERWLSSETYRNQASGVVCSTRLVSIRRFAPTRPALDSSFSQYSPNFYMHLLLAFSLNLLLSCQPATVGWAATPSRWEPRSTLRWHLPPIWTVAL
jgi:hypothetical protein